MDDYTKSLMESLIGRVVMMAEGGDKPELTLVDVKQGDKDKDCWKRHRQNRYGGRSYAHDGYCPSTKIRIFPSAEGETVMTWLTNRRFVPTAELRPLVREALTRCGYGPEVKFRWNQKAGCGCGCSPAFVASVAGANIDFIYGLAG